MFVVFFRAIILYALVVFALRLMGKRQIGELQPAELVITILISNITSLPIEDTDIPMTLGMIPVLVLVASEILVSELSLRSRRFRSVLSGNPVVLIQNGVLDQRQMRRLRVSIDDLMESLRQNGVFDLQDVQYAIVETNGNLSVFQKSTAQPVTAGQLQLAGDDADPPAVVISDGRIVRPALQACGLTEDWVTRTLRARGQQLGDVFLMTADSRKQICIVKKAPPERRAKHRKDRGEGSA